MHKEKEISKEIYLYLKNQITSGILSVNEKVSERYLCEIFKTSRTTVRSAINRLENDGWLYVKAKSGTYVSPVNLDDVKDNYEIRLIIEPEMLLMAYPYLKKCDFERMKENCVRMSLHDDSSYIDSESDNHAVIRERCPNKTIVKVLGRLIMNYNRVSTEAALGEARKNASTSEWRDIIAALENKNPVMAAHHLKLHLLNSSAAFWKNHRDV